MIVKAHTSIIGETGYNCHSRNFFKALHKLVPVQVRNFTVGSSWGGYDNDEPHNKEYYIDDILKTILVEQTLNTPNGRQEFSLYTKYKNEGNPDVHIVLNENNHHYFYDNYDGKKIAYNVWETTKYQDDFLERLKTFDQVWVPTQWQKDCTVEQGIPEWKVKVVPEGVDVKTYKPKNYVVSKPVDRPFRFILVGRWDYRKSTKEIIETFIKTFSEDENVELLVNVDNPFAYDGMNSTEERFEKYGIKHSGIKILHHLSKDEYIETLKSVDVFLSCARGEGWNLPLIEAMSCGIPSLYSNWGAQLEFAGGRGIPVDILGEVPANVQGGDLYFSWTKDAPGNFAEPNFEDLSKKMRDVVNNYTIYKKKSLDESDEIREIFTWENAAKIAKRVLDEFMIHKNNSKSTVSVVIARADTHKRKELLRKCIESIDTEIILSTNYPVDPEIQDLVNWVVYENENPILLKDDFSKYNVGYYYWKQKPNGEREYIPYEYEHSYAAYRLTRVGLEKAESLNKSIVHIINYDYEIHHSVLEHHEQLMEANDIVLYKHNDWDLNTSAYCSAFMTGRLNALLAYYTIYSTKEEFYNSMNGFNILELNLSSYYTQSDFKKVEFNIQDLKTPNKVNQESAGNIHNPYDDTMKYPSKKIQSNKNTDSITIVLAHADTLYRKKLLRECLETISGEIILSSNFVVESDIQQMCDYVVYTKHNPLLFSDDFKKYDISYNFWWIDENGEKHTKPFEYEHGYAVYTLIQNGLRYAKLLGKSKVHILNYDYRITHEFFNKHTVLLNEHDLVFYTQEDVEYDGIAYNSACFSGKLSSLESFFEKYDSLDSYYSDGSGLNILEKKLSNHYQKSDHIIYHEKIDALKQIALVNREGLLDISNSEKYDGLSFQELCQLFDCDKAIVHDYHKVYELFISKFRDKEINLFEIGIDAGKSLRVWQNYLPFASIYGMDISKKYDVKRGKIFIGDQNNINDLISIKNQIPKCQIIVDDGSHVADHQLKSFNYLFENLLDWGGVYVIEDVECSYWGPEEDIYGYETGYANIIDYFSKLNHSVNHYYSNNTNPLHIESISYYPNCIVITKKDKESHDKPEYRFKHKLSQKTIERKTNSNLNTNMNNLIDNNDVLINFVDGPFVEIKGNKAAEWNIDFIDSDTGKTVYSTKLRNNQWAKANSKTFTNWLVSIHTDGEDNQPFVHRFDLSGKRVFIVFESASLGDTIAWIPYVEEFRKKHNCKVIVSTFHNQLFQSEYPDIEFVKPGTTVNNLYALYRIGWFYKDGKPNYDMNKSDFTKISLQQTASDILGLEFKEIVPKIHKPIPHKSEKPYICIANHSTAQSKYWNNPTGWQELVDYVKSIGYDVYLLSREEDGYMGNKNPVGVIKVDRKSLEEIGSILLGSNGFIGLGSGLSWYAWSLGVPTILISGFSEKYQEMSTGIHRIINENVCHGCFGRHTFDKGDWNWCPEHKGTDRQFECTKTITFDMIKPYVDKILRLND